MIEKLEEKIKEHNQLKLVIIDTLQRVKGEAKPRETTYQYDYRSVGAIKKLADKYGISVFLVHHNRKMKDSDDPFNMISGTNGIMGAVDTTWVLTKEKRNKSNVTLHITGRDVIQDNISLSFNKDICRWERDSKISTQDADFELVLQTIEKTLDASPQKEWKVSASDIIKEVKALFNCELSFNAQRLGYLLDDKEELIKERHIFHSTDSRGTASNLHVFQKMIRHPEKTHLDELDWDDEPPKF